MRTFSSRCEPTRQGACLAALVALVAQGAASAQDAPADASQRVVVTGSQVPRIDAETALPVQIIRREEIERSGAANVEEVVGRIAATMNNPVQAQTIGNSKTPGFSGASLRGFGTQYTLVLLNGRRLSNYAFGEDGLPIGTDLHAIPLAAIDRVEVLTDGASAIYGSDAVAGVINFILRGDFRGVQADVEHRLPLAGGGARDHQTLTLGAGDPAANGYNVLTVVDHQHDQALAATRRAFSTTAYQPDIALNQTSFSVWPANFYTQSTGLVNPLAPACPAHTILIANVCRFDAASQAHIVPDSDTLGMLARGDIALGVDGQVYAEWVWSRQRIVDHISASPVYFGNLDNPVVISPGSRFYPTIPGLTGDIVNPLYRSLPLGPRVDVTRTESARVLIGWHGRAGGWDIDTAAMQSVSRASDTFVSGIVDLQEVADAISSGEVNAFGDSGAAGDAALAATQLRGVARTSRADERSVDLRAVRDVASLAGGMATVGIGAETRRESLTDRPTDLSRRAAGGAFANPKGGSRDVTAMFAELALPLVRGLDLQAAVRVDHYGDFGTTTNPKLALRWQPTPALMLRASGGTGFRAPSLSELFTPQGIGPGDTGNIVDPVRCKVTHLEEDCKLFVNFRLGGNPALRPERSRQSTLGLVLKPAEGALASADWWHVTVSHTITTLPDDVILSGDPRFELTNIIRGPVEAAWPGLPGPIVELIETNQNVGRASSSGVDLALHYVMSSRPWGRLGMKLEGSYLADTRIAFDGVHEAASAGESTYGSSFPRWQHTATLDFDREQWGATAVQTWRSGYRDFNLVNGEPRRVAPYRLWHLQVRYTGLPGWTLAGGIDNLFDVNPPRSNQIAGFQNGYDPSYTDPRGRTLYARVSVRWQ